MTLQVNIGKWMQLPVSGPQVQLFVIGDIHGQAAALRKALGAIAGIPRSAAVRRLVFLGDLIDRGPYSLAVLALAMEAREHALVDDVIILPGNHELMLLDGLDAPQHHLGDWLDNGGEELIEEAEPGCTARKLVDLAAVARRAIPEAFIDLIRSGPTWHQEGDLLLVHAGLDPDVGAMTHLARSRLLAFDDTHWAWIRAPFLEWTGGWGPDRGWIVVHGHTPAVEAPVTLSTFAKAADKVASHRRIALDAGATVGLEQIAFLEAEHTRYRLALVHAVADS